MNIIKYYNQENENLKQKIEEENEKDAQYIKSQYNKDLKNFHENQKKQKSKINQEKSIFYGY